MDTSIKKTITIVFLVIVIIASIVIMIWQIQHQMAYEVSTYTIPNVVNTHTNPPSLLKINDYQIKLSAEDIIKKKAEIVKRVKDTTHILTPEERKSVSIYVSGSNGDQFGFTDAEKVLIINALNKIK